MFHQILTIISLNIAPALFYLSDSSMALLSLMPDFHVNLLYLLSYLRSFYIFWSFHASDQSFIHWFSLLLHLNCQWTHLLIFNSGCYFLQFYDFHFVLSQISHITFFFRLAFKFSQLDLYLLELSKHNCFTGLFWSLQYFKSVCTVVS